MSEEQIRALVDRLIERRLSESPLMQELEVIAFSDGFLGKKPAESRALMERITPAHRQQLVREIRTTREELRPLDFSDEQRFIEFNEKHCKKNREAARKDFHDMKEKNPNGLRELCRSFGKPSAA